MPVWLNGERHATTLAPFDLADRGLTLGDGVFDTALVLEGRAVFRGAHLKRLGEACAALAIPFDAGLAGETMDAVAGEVGTGSLRLTVTRGPGPRGIAPPEIAHPTLLGTGAAGPPALAFKPLRLRPTAIRRNETSPASRLKTLNYLDAVVALGEAKRDGFDEALFLNTRERVASAGTGNLFVLKDGTLRTPPLAEGVLPGIVRGVVLELGARAGLTTEEARVEPDALFAADAVFMTNSLRLLAPVEAIGDRRLARTADLHPLGQALADAIASDCGAALPLVEGTFEGLIPPSGSRSPGSAPEA